MFVPDYVSTRKQLELFLVENIEKTMRVAHYHILTVGNPLTYWRKQNSSAKPQSVFAYDGFSAEDCPTTTEETVCLIP